MTWFDDEHMQDDQSRHDGEAPQSSLPPDRERRQDNDDTRLSGQTDVPYVPPEADAPASQAEGMPQQTGANQPPHSQQATQPQQTAWPQAAQPQPAAPVNPYMPPQPAWYGTSQQAPYATQPQPVFPEPANTMPANTMPAGAVPPLPHMPASPYPQAFQGQPQQVAPPMPGAVPPQQQFQQPVIPPQPAQPTQQYPPYPRPIAQPQIPGYAGPQFQQHPPYPPYLPQIFPPAQFIQTLPGQWQAWWEQKRRVQAAKHDYSLVGWALLLMIGIWLVGALAVTIGVLLAFSKSESIPTGLLLLLSNVPLYAVGMPVSLLVFRNVPRLATRRLDMPAVTFIKLLIATVPVMAIGSIIGNLIAAPFSKGGTDTLESALEHTDYLSLFLLTCVCAPIFEEWIFRKEIISRTRKYGEKTAIVVSALCFGLFHGNIRQFVYAFGLGLILGYIYVRTSKLWYTMLMHALVNLNGGIISMWATTRVDTDAFQRTVDQGGPDAVLRAVEDQLGGVIIMAGYIVVMLGLFIAGIVILVRERRNFVFFDAPEELPSGTGAKTAFGNPGMIVFIILGVLMTLGSLLSSSIPSEGSFDVGGDGTGMMVWQTFHLLGMLVA
ncbi:type II CAAX prenyl endopeptidase Rce1 family protein [Bifidobacterium thermophilum]|uniref:CPBP family glutamic-type intramembrane protease n=1 Tax=Bifidobacterium thermophilum TaxID=33905 RepID=UPI0030A6EC77